MLFATFQEATTTLILAGMLLGGSALTVALAAWVIHMGRRNNGRPNMVRIVIASLLVFSSVPGWFSGGLLLLAAVVTARCPEARDCLF